MQQKLSRKILYKAWRLSGLNKLLKSCKKLDQRQDEAALKAYRIPLVIFY